MSTNLTSIPQPSPSPVVARCPPRARTPDLKCESAAVAAVADEPRASARHWISGLAVESAPYSIRIPVPAGEARCPRCLSLFLAAGPTGYVDEQPICDLCLLDGSQPLGMVLALAAVTRSFAAVDPRNEAEYREAAEALAAFARIYERVAARSGPARAFQLPDGLEQP
jgi:hypothetical protein